MLCADMDPRWLDNGGNRFQYLLAKRHVPKPIPTGLHDLPFKYRVART